MLLDLGINQVIRIAARAFICWGYEGYKIKSPSETKRLRNGLNANIPSEFYFSNYPDKQTISLELDTFQKPAYVEINGRNQFVPGLPRDLTSRY